MTGVENIKAVKQCRKNIDNVLQEVKNLPNSREVSLSITKLQEGVMWLGMDLKRLGVLYPEVSSNPYPNSYNTENNIIEKTADDLTL